MKKTLFLFLTLVLATVSVSLRAAGSRQEPNQINISSAQELLDNLGSDRILVITEGYINLTEALLDDANDHLHVSYEEKETTDKTVFYYMETDGPELHIRGLKNLTILSGLDVVSIVIDPRYANVFTFENCENINLVGLTLGHTEEGYCDKGVLGFEQCSGVFLNNCDLYGCGTEGISASGCESMYFSGVKIRDCSYYIMHLMSCTAIEFNACQFFRNREYELVNIYDCDGVTFTNCMFANNSGTLFNVQCPVTLDNCVVLHDEMFIGELEYINWINSIYEFYWHSEQTFG